MIDKPVPTFSCLFVSRPCPRNCSYCLSKDVRGKNKRLSGIQWVDAIHILDEIGVKFHLILGNEVLAMGEGLIDLIKGLEGRTDYAMYSTFVEPWYSAYRGRMVDAGLYNISCGIDYLPTPAGGRIDSNIWLKSNAGFRGLLWFKDRGVPDVHGTITIHKGNLDSIETLLDILTEKGIWAALNTIEYSKDGKHDFFGDWESLGDLAFTDSDRPKLYDVGSRLAEGIRNGRWMVQTPPEYCEELGTHGLEQSWHCKMPLIITLEEDGHLRACGYRPGHRLLSYNVWDIWDGTLSVKDLMRLQRLDCRECPGCHWSYWWQAEHYWRRGQSSLIISKYQTHFSEHWNQG